MNDINEEKVYNFICAVANPEGHLSPVSVLESVVSDMTGNMVKTICSNFHDRYKELMNEPIGKYTKPTYLHVDMFKGFIPALALAFNNTDGSKYVRDLFKHICNPTVTMPYRCIIVWCYSHLMCGIAKRNPQFYGPNSKVTEDHKQDYKVLMMQIVRNIKCSTDLDDIEHNINALKLILEQPIFDFNQCQQDLQYVNLMDLAPKDESIDDTKAVCNKCCVL